MSKKIAILGSTGSIGTQTFEVINRHRDEFQVLAIAAGSNVEEVIRQARLYQPEIISMATKEAAEAVQSEFDSSSTRIMWGEEGLLAAAVDTDAEIVLTAVVGTLGLQPTIAALEAGKNIALANKETMVAAGHIVTQLAQKNGCTILPVDSEHSAIFQCLHKERRRDIRKITLTASGGPFREKSRESMATASQADALAHPNWSMGSKITIDSATLMNKALEVIEAHWLFDIPYDQIGVVIHPQSIIHSFVEFVDRSVLAQMGAPKMNVPIQYALTYPNRLEAEWPELDLVKLGQLTFFEPDLERFPCLGYAFHAGRIGGSMTTVLNAANEVASISFLEGKIGFLDIESILYRVMEKHDVVTEPTLEEIIFCDQWARELARTLITS